MGKGKGTKVYIGEDKQLHAVVCGAPECLNLVKDNQEKYCCEKCRKRVMTLKSMDRYKGVYKDMKQDGWAGGPRGLSTVPSSIKHDETHVTGNGRFVVDDYRVDPDIFAIAEANHEQYILDRNEYENKVVIDGLEVFTKEYNKHHDVSYQREQAKKREANLTEDQKIARAKQNKRYQKENKEKIRAKQQARYKANPEKYRKIHREYYLKNKDKIKKYHKKYYEEKVRKPDLFMLEQWLKKRTSGS